MIKSQQVVQEIKICKVKKANETFYIAPAKPRIFMYSRVLTRVSTYRADLLKVVGYVEGDKNERRDVN